MRNRWIRIAKWGTLVLFLSVSILLGWIIGHAWAKAYEMHVTAGIHQPFRPWSATLRIAWDFLSCFYVLIPVLLTGFAGLRFFSSHFGDFAQNRRSDNLFALGAVVLMLLGSFSVALRSSAVQW
jgi:hypothetical protein